MVLGVHKLMIHYSYSGTMLSAGMTFFHPP